jgi:thymidylate kinase
MKIILEGADGTGKTTLAKLLAEKYGLDICHCTRDDPADYDFYKHTARKENVVWDRHTIGELIYPEVFNREPQIGVEGVRLVLGYARENKGRIFILTTDLDTIKSRLKNKGEEFSEVIENIEKINEKFLFYADIFSIPVIDTSKMTIQEIFDLVEKEPKEYKFIHK